MDSPTRTLERNLPRELREVSVVHMTDPTAIRGSIEILNQDVVNLDPAGFEVKRVTVPLAACCLLYQLTNAALRTRTRIHNQWARQGAQIEFMDSLVTTIESCDPDNYVDTDKKGRSYSQIVRACEDYTLKLDGRRVDPVKHSCQRHPPSLNLPAPSSSLCQPVVNEIMNVLI